MTVVQIIILILEGIHLVFGVFGIPIQRMRKGGGLFGSILLCWGLYIIWGLVWCLILPAIVSPFSKAVFLMFPEVTGLPFIVVFGCLPSVLVCTIAHGIVRPLKRRSPSQATDEPSSLRKV